MHFYVMTGKTKKTMVEKTSISAILQFFLQYKDFWYVEQTGEQITQNNHRSSPCTNTGPTLGIKKWRGQKQLRV